MEVTCGDLYLDRYYLLKRTEMDSWQYLIPYIIHGESNTRYSSYPFFYYVRSVKVVLTPVEQSSYTSVQSLDVIPFLFTCIRFHPPLVVVGEGRGVYRWEPQSKRIPTDRWMESPPPP